MCNNKAEIIKSLSDKTKVDLIKCKEVLEYCDYDIECAEYYLNLTKGYSIYDSSAKEEIDIKIEEYINNKKSS